MSAIDRRWWKSHYEASIVGGEGPEGLEVEVRALDQVGAAVLGVVLALGGLIVLTVLILRWATRSGRAKGLVLEETSPVSQAATGVIGEPTELLGKRGVALTPLRPAGTAMFDDQRLDVVTEATFIPQGATVEVTAVEGKRIIVRQVSSTGLPGALA